MRNLVCGAAAVLLLVVLPSAHAQNKCVDAKGRVTYQQDPCPGMVKVPAQAPARAAEAPKQRAALEKDCLKTGREISQRRAGLSQLPPERRADEEHAVGMVEQSYRERCTRE